MFRRDRRITWQRFWCPRDGRYATDSDGFVRPPHPWPGSEYWEPTASARLAAIPCLVLLGEPGIGKSCALIDMVDATRRSLSVDELLLPVDLRDHRNIDEVFARPEFQAWRSGERPLCLFVDSLDERRNADDASRLLGALNDGPLHRLRLRVACRTGELPLRFGRALIEWWGEPKAVAHFELLPLTRDDVLAAARVADLDAEAFLAELLRRDVVALATRPITLQFLIELFRAQRCLSKDRGELYRSGCAYLCREPSITRHDHRQRGALDVARRLVIARRIAAVSVLSQKHVVYLECPLAGLPPDAVDLQALAGGPAGPFAITAEAVEEVIAQTGLFTARGEGCFGWAHLTYAEFLAAEYLHERIPDADGLRRFLMPASLAGQVPLALRGVASWLSVRDDALFSALLADDVSVLLHADLGEPGDTQRAAIVARLLDCVAAADLLDPDVSDATYARLRHPGLAEQLRPWIEDRRAYFMARRVAIGIAEGCALTSLASSLLEVACNDDEAPNMRAEALAAFTTIASPEYRVRVRTLLVNPTDPNDQLRGYALAYLRKDLDTDELIRYLVPPNNSSHVGKYYHLINHELVQDLVDEDLPRMLDWLQTYGELKAGTADVDFIDRAAAMLRRRAWTAMHQPDVLSRLTRIVEARLRQGEDVFGGHAFFDLEPSSAVLLDDQERRRVIVTALVDSDMFPQLGGFHLCAQSGLVRMDDLGWLVQEFEGATEEALLGRWMELIVYRMEGTYSDEDIEPVLALAERHPPLRHQLQWLLGPIERNSPTADRLRHEHEANERARAVAQDFATREGFDLPPRERLLHLLGRAERGDHGALSSLLSALRGNARGQPWMWVSADLVHLPGWSDASPETRERVLTVVRTFLARDDPGARTWFRHPSHEAYQALRLLAARDRTWLDRQQVEFWRRWAPTIVTCPIRDGAEDHVALLQWGRRHAPDEFLWALAFRTDSELQCGQVTTARGLGNCWDDEIGALLLAKAHDPATAGEGLAALLGLVLIRSVAGARDLCEALLAGSVSDPSRARAGALALLVADAERSWAAVTASFAADPALAEAVLCDLSSDDVTAMAARCSASRAADVYAWIAEARGNEPEHVATLQAALRKQLTGRGTIPALDAIRRLRAAFPGDDMLSIAHAMARKALGAKGWTPWSIGDVFLLRHGSPASNPEDAYAALVYGLCDLFHTPELVRDWLRRWPFLGLGPHDLPLEGTSSSAFTWMAEFVDKLVARGIGADELRGRLDQEFPGSAQAITRIHGLWTAVSRAHGWTSAAGLTVGHRSA